MQQSAASLRREFDDKMKNNEEMLIRLQIKQGQSEEGGKELRKLKVNN